MDARGRTNMPMKSKLTISSSIHYPRARTLRALPIQSGAPSLKALLLAAVCLIWPLWGQANWTVNGTTVSVPSTSNVGIGTTSPSFRLTNSPCGNITDQSGLGLAGSNSFVWEHFASDSNFGYSSAILNSLANPNAGGLLIKTTDTGPSSKILTLNSGGTNRFSVCGNGNIGIGTSSPSYLLAVNGTIGAKEVIVTNTGWADYVFDPSYTPDTLSEVAAYIAAHHRLPEMPSEKEVKEHGVSLGEMQVKLLAKIEELTLHMIRSEEESKRLTQENLSLKERIARLEARPEK
jgi:hypothetical protein